MSGIAVIHDTSGALIERELLDGLLEAVNHRGPTVFNWSGPGIALGQRTLATTEEAQQEALPISLAGGRYQVAFDGRLDNRSTLLETLAASAGDRVHTDPELVVLAYERWGDLAVRRLIGDFAFVLWDVDTRRLLAARDQRGFRPLVYTRHSRRFIFGSEPRQLFAFPDIARTVDSRFLACHLTGGAPPPGSTPYASIAEVPAGHYVVVEGGTLRLQEYWRFEPGQTLTYRRSEEYVEHFEAVFGEAIAALTRTSTRPAVLLSGGLDSSYVAARVLEQAADVLAIHGFVPGSVAMDEREYAGGVAAHLGISRREVDVSDCWSLSSRYLPLTTFDQPDVPMQAAMMVKLARSAAESGSNVILDGVGGDEFAAGGEDYIARLILAGRPLDAYREAGAWSGDAGVSRARVLARAGLLQMIPMGIRHRTRSLRGRPTPTLTPPWLDLFSLRAVGLEFAIPQRQEPSLWNQRGEYASFWTSQVRGGLPALGWRDRNVAGPEGVEFRSPFWDLRVMELLGSMPSWVHRSAGQPKALLRAAMKPRLPQEVVERRDKGIFDELMDQGIEAEAGRIEASLDGPLSRLLYVNTEILREETHRYRSMRHRWWHPVWRAFTGGLWLLAEEGPSSPQVAGAGTPTPMAVNQVSRGREHDRFTGVRTK